jgi:hypothetical protein
MIRKIKEHFFIKKIYFYLFISTQNYKSLSFVKNKLLEKTFLNNITKNLLIRFRQN